METTDQKPDDAPFVHTGMNRTPIRSDRTGRALSGERLRVRFFSVGIVRSSAPCCVYDRRCACAGACACACAGEHYESRMNTKKFSSTSLVILRVSST